MLDWPSCIPPFRIPNIAVITEPAVYLTHRLTHSQKSLYFPSLVAVDDALRNGVGRVAIRQTLPVLRLVSVVLEPGQG